MKDSNDYYQDTLLNTDSQKDRLQQENDSLARKVNDLEYDLSQS